MRYRVKALRGASEVAMLPVDALNEAEAIAFANRQGYEVVSVRREGAFSFRHSAGRSWIQRERQYSTVDDRRRRL